MKNVKKLELIRERHLKNLHEILAAPPTTTKKMKKSDSYLRKYCSPKIHDSNRY